MQALCWEPSHIPWCSIHIGRLKNLESGVSRGWYGSQRSLAQEHDGVKSLDGLGPRESHSWLQHQSPLCQTVLWIFAAIPLCIFTVIHLFRRLTFCSAHEPSCLHASVKGGCGPKNYLLMWLHVLLRYVKCSLLSFPLWEGMEGFFHYQIQIFRTE